MLSNARPSILAVLAVLSTLGLPVANSTAICYLHQSQDREGEVRWVAPVDPCACDQMRPGGINVEEDGQPSTGYLEDVLFTQDTDELMDWFGCGSGGTPETSTHSTLTPAPENFTSCQGQLLAGNNVSGLYTIYPNGTSDDGIAVYCDMETAGGGWIVIQRRQDGSVDFYRDWLDYSTGFGNLSGEFWLGNDYLRLLTATGRWELRVDLLDWAGNRKFSEYGTFRVHGETFTLNVEDYKPNSGTDAARDSLLLHDGEAFSTRDQDNDGFISGSCARGYKGAWWYIASCVYSHLNGPYQEYDKAILNDGEGILWVTFTSYKSLKETEMKIRKTL